MNTSDGTQLDPCSTTHVDCYVLTQQDLTIYWLGETYHQPQSENATLVSVIGYETSDKYAASPNFGVVWDYDTTTIPPQVTQLSETGFNSDLLLFVVLPIALGAIVVGVSISVIEWWRGRKTVV